MTTQSSLIDDLKQDYPKIEFQSSKVAHWSPSKKTIYYDNSPMNTIHELGHALLGHTSFIQDIELIRIERDAWEKAREIAKNYQITISDNVIESAMDNYREWLHKRSLCPKCSQVGIQSLKKLSYTCVNCGTRWQANDARSCGLKRKVIKN